MIVGHAELAQAGAQRDAALSAADDHHLGLGRVAELFGLALALFEPGLAVGLGPVRHAHGAVGARGLLVTLERDRAS